MNQCNKGKAGEREAAHKLAEIFRLPVNRGQQHAGGEDTPDIKGLPGLHVEVKRVERLNVEDAMRQAERDCNPVTQLPIVMHRRNRTAWLITFRADQVLRMVDTFTRLIDEGHRQTTNNNRVRDAINAAYAFQSRMEAEKKIRGWAKT